MPGFGFSIGPSYGYQQPYFQQPYQDPAQCWRWSHKRHHWVWRCGPQAQYPVYPQYQYQPYPFFRPAPSLGFFFGFGGFGGDHERHHHHD